jgi:hypothetical protein
MWLTIGISTNTRKIPRKFFIRNISKCLSGLLVTIVITALFMLHYSRPYAIMKRNMGNYLQGIVIVRHKIMIDIRINEWSKLNFADPAAVLPQLRQLQLEVSTSNLNEKTRNLRTNKLKPYREGWEAALFCYGMSKLIDATVYVVPYEASDYDAVAMWVKEETQHFAPIQIKELISHELNPNTDINKEIAKLKRYTASNDTTFVLHVNRPCRLELQAIEIPKLNIASLWLIGATTPDQSRWFVAGDMLNNPTMVEYEYPIV